MTEYFSPVSLLPPLIWLAAGFYALKVTIKLPLGIEKLRPWLNLAALLLGPVVLILRGAFLLYERFVAPALRKMNQKPEAILFDAHGREIQTQNGEGGSAISISMMKQLIADAVRSSADDIFLDPKPNSGYTLKFRSSAGMKQIRELMTPEAAVLISAVKIAAGLDSYERKRPQTGALSAHYKERQAKLQVSTIGVLGGEKLSIHITVSTVGVAVKKTIDQIGLPDDWKNAMHSILGTNSGLIVLAAPPESGLSETYCAVLRTLNSGTRTIVSIEDPVGEPIENVTQLEVNPKADMPFNVLLENAVAQNADVIAVTKIKDAAALVAIAKYTQAGHLVLAQIPAPDLNRAAERLTSMGITMKTLGMVLSAILVQRRLNRLCPSCRKPQTLPESYAEYFTGAGLPASSIFAKGDGCPACGGSGFAGTADVFDLLTVDSELKALMERPEATPREVREFLNTRNGGASMLVYQALCAVSRGEVSLEEVEATVLKED